MLFLMRNVHRGDLEESSGSSTDAGLLGHNRYRDDSRSSGSGGSTTSHAGSYVVNARATAREPRASIRARSHLPPPPLALSYAQL
jgi:hypothetical protein